MLAFLTYLVSQFVGDHTGTESVPVVLKVLRDYVPAMQTWIERGLFDIIHKKTVTNWVNALLLGWSALGLFSSMTLSMERLPNLKKPHHTAHVTELFMALLCLGLFTAFAGTAVLVQLINSAKYTPLWIQELPSTANHLFLFASQSGALFVGVSIFCVGVLYKALIPTKLSWRSTFLSAALFTALVGLSRAAYWIYLHYNRTDIQTSFGIFSTLILILLWTYFVISCLLYCGLFAVNLNRFSSEVKSLDSDQDSKEAEGSAESAA